MNIAFPRAAAASWCAGALFLLAGCSDSSSYPEPGPPTSVAATYTPLAPGEVRLHTHPADPIFLSSRAVSGELLEISAVRTATGNIERATRIRTQVPGEPALVVHLDEQQRVVKAEADGVGGLHLNWLTNDIVHLRMSNERQEVTLEWWVDAFTGDEVPRPEPRLAGWTHSADPREAEALSRAVAPGVTALSATGGDTSVRIPILDCEGVVSEQASNLIDRVWLELDVGSAVFELPASREPGGIWQATVPRQLTSIEWNTAECLDALGWLADLCPVIDLLNSGVLRRLCARIPVTPVTLKERLLCQIVRAGLGVFCADADRSMQAICSGAAGVFNLGELIFGDVSHERRLRAVAALRTCSAEQDRESSWEPVNASTLSVTLPVNGCQPDREGGWNAVVLADFVGAGFGDSESGFSVLEGTDPSQPYVPTGEDGVFLGPLTETEHCFWPQELNALDRIDTVVEGSLRSTYSFDGGDFEPGYYVTRTLYRLRDPTAEEIQSGVHLGYTECLEAPLEINAGAFVTHEFFLKPFQKAIITVSQSGVSGFPGSSTETFASFMWPRSPDGSTQNYELTSNGSVEIVVTHDDLRWATSWISDLIQGQLPPGFPPLVDVTLDRGNQCYGAILLIGTSSTLEVTGDGIWQTAPRLYYDIEIVTE